MSKDKNLNDALTEELAVKSAHSLEGDEATGLVGQDGASEEDIKGEINPEKTPKKVGENAKGGKRKADKKAALKKLRKLKKQIKQGDPAAIKEVRQAATSCYGERLAYPGGFPVYCSRYAVIIRDVPKLVMRFFNASDVLVTGLRFSIVEKDKNGNVIEETKLERTGLFAERGTEFAVADAQVSKSCCAVEVKMESVISEDYEYLIDGEGRAALKYGASEEGGDFYFKNKPMCVVKKRRRLYVLLSLSAVIVATLVAVVVAYKLGIFKKAVYNFLSAETTCQISGADYYEA